MYGLRGLLLGQGKDHPVGVLALQPSRLRRLAGQGEYSLRGPLGGLGTRPRGTEPVGGSGQFALRPESVGRGAVGVPHGTPGQLGGLLQLTGAAHLGTGPQRLVPGPQTGALLPQLLRSGLGLGKRLDGHREVVLSGVQLGAQGFVTRMLSPGRTGFAAGGDPRIPTVVLEKGVRRPLGRHHDGQLLLLLVQGAERLGDIRHHGLVHRRQRLGERLGKRLLAGPLGQLRLAQLDQQVHQGRIALLAEPEQRLVHRPAVGARRVVHQSPAVRRIGQPVAADRGAGGVQQPQFPAHPLVGHEVPMPGDTATGHGFQATAEGGVAGRTVLVQTAELDPGVPEPFGMRVLATEQQVPLHALLRIGVGLHPVRCQVAVQQEGQGQGEHLGFARAVVAPHQQAAVAEVELLDVVIEEVDQADPQRLPAGAARGRQWSSGHGARHALVPFVLFVPLAGFCRFLLGVLCPGSRRTVSPTR